ncbi:MAG: bile acid:sodium symporter family protein [Bacteroidota bacterium]
MQENRTVYSWVIIIGLGVLIVAFIAKLFSDSLLLGLPMIAGFVLLAIGSLKFERIKSLSYTLWIFAAVIASLYYPQYFLIVGGFKLSNLIVPLLQIIMFGMGTTMSLKDFHGVIKMPKAVFIGVICQFSIMPLIGTGLAYSFGFPPEIAAGLILVGSSPSGLASNVMAFIAKANVALSITLTAVATLLAPLLTPILMKYLAGQFIPIDFWGMMGSIVKMLIIPITAGLLFNRMLKEPYSWQKQFSKWMGAVLGILAMAIAILLKIYVQTPPSVSLLFEFFWIILMIFGLALLLEKVVQRREIIDQIMPLISMISIAIIITIITAAGRDSLLQVGILLIVACLIHNLLGYTMGYWACKLVGLDKKSCRTIALEVGLQNSGLASGLAKEMGRLATVGLAPAIFGPLMNITGSSLASWWRYSK